MDASHWRNNDFSFSREVKVIQKKLKQLQADSDKKDAKLYENMFARKTKDSPMAIKVNVVV